MSTTTYVFVETRGASNEYHNICFRGEIRKILYGYPLLSVALLPSHIIPNEY